MRLVEILKTHSENTTDLLTSSKVETTKTAQRQQYDGIFTPPGKTTTATTEVLIIHYALHWGRSTVPSVLQLHGYDYEQITSELTTFNSSLFSRKLAIKCKKNNNRNQIPKHCRKAISSGMVCLKKEAGRLKLKLNRSIFEHNFTLRVQC